MFSNTLGLVLLGTVAPALAALGSNDLDVLARVGALADVKQSLYHQMTYDSLPNRGGLTWFLGGSPVKAVANYGKQFTTNYFQAWNTANSDVHQLAAFGDLRLDSSCNYNYKFSAKDPETFFAELQMLEELSIATYAGAIPLIEDSELSAFIIGILSVSARNAAFLRSIRSQVITTDATDAPITLDQSYSFVSEYRSNCSASEPPLQDKIFPSMSLVGKPHPHKASKATFQISGNASLPDQQLYIVYSSFSKYYSAESYSAEAIINHQKGTAHVSSLGIALWGYGQTYAILATSNATWPVANADTVAGPAIFEMP